MREFPRTGNDSPATSISMRKPYNTMKNTSLSVPLGNAKGTPSAEPPEAKLLSATDRAGVIGAGSLEAPNRLLQKGTQFIPEQHKIDNAKSENRSLEDFPFCIVYFVCAQRSRKRTKFFFTGKSRRLFSVGKNLFVFTFPLVEHSSRQSWRSQPSFYCCFVHFISFPNGRCFRHLRTPCPIYEN